MKPTSVSMGDVQDRLYSACIILLPTWSLSMSPSHPSIRFRSLRLVLWAKRLPTFSFGGVKRRVTSRQVPIRLLCAPMECSKTRNIVPLFLLVLLTIRSDALQVNVSRWTRLVAILCLWPPKTIWMWFHCPPTFAPIILSQFTMKFIQYAYLGSFAQMDFADLHARKRLGVVSIE